MQYDLLIRNGRVFDGLGNSEHADIVIHAGQVVLIRPHLNISALREIDATGLWVTPGFIDIHTHYDLEVEVFPELSESVRHGVTSIVMGGCSLSATFGEPDELAHIFSRVETLAPELISEWLNRAKSWPSPKAYFDHLAQLPLIPNIASMLGHSALRVRVMGLERSLHAVATDAEIEAMRALAEEALSVGCIGISVDMVHWHKVSGLYAGRALPSHHADYREYRVLAEVCRKRDAVFQVTPDPANPWSILDIFRLCNGTGKAPLRCTVLSAMDMDVAPALWRFFPLIATLANHVLGCNIRFQTLAEPFTIYADGHLTPLFEEFSAGVKLNNCKSPAERKALWENANFRQEFIRSWQSGFPKTFHRDLSRMTIISAPDQNIAGKTFAQACKADGNGKEPLAFFMDCLEQYDEALRWVACGANQRPTIRQTLMKHPYILPGFSDAGAHSRNLAFFDSALSVLRQSVQTGFLSPEKAVARITREPARWFNLDVGYLAEGRQADIVILDPAKLSQPIPEAVAVEDTVLKTVRMVKRDPDPTIYHVLIQGQEVIRYGEPIALPKDSALGKVMRQHRPTQSETAAQARFRNRISEDRSLPEGTDYWLVFLHKHQNPANVGMHCFALLLTYIIPLLALYCHNPWLLLLFPVSHLIGLIGHLCFERTPIDRQDMIFSWRAGISLHRMLFSVLQGKYRQDVEQALKVDPILC